MQKYINLVKRLTIFQIQDVNVKKKPSLKDIAERVGVSTALVSYVLNNTRKGRVSEEIANKIRKVAEKLQYRPNQLAKSLKTNRSFTIGLIVADIANPFSSTLVRMIEDEAEKNQYMVIIGSSDEKAIKQKKLIDLFMDRRVDAIIIAPAEGTEDQLSTLVKNQVPLVIIDRVVDMEGACMITINNRQLAREGVECLIKNGYKRIGMIGFKTQLVHLNDRKKGYKEALKKNRMDPDKELIREVAVEVNTEQEVIQAIDELMNFIKPVDALFFASNKITTFALKYLNSKRSVYPVSPGLLSFDQSDAVFIYNSPIYYVRQPLKEMAETAVSLALQQVTTKKKLNSNIILEGRLVC